MAKNNQAAKNYNLKIHKNVHKCSDALLQVIPESYENPINFVFNQKVFIFTDRQTDKQTDEEKSFFPKFPL